MNIPIEVVNPYIPEILQHVIETGMFIGITFEWKDKLPKDPIGAICRVFNKNIFYVITGFIWILLIDRLIFQEKYMWDPPVIFGIYCLLLQFFFICCIIKLLFVRGIK